jgi:4-amino-4-deoxy-L-arabinose transferase-like glycosyltransferase
MTLARSQLALFLILILCDAIILFSPDWLWLRFPAALTLVFILPGWAWLTALNWLQTDDAIERLTLIPGVSSVLAALALFIALFIPGPFTETPNLIALNLATLTGLIWGMANQRMANKTTTLHPPSSVNTLSDASRKSKIPLIGAEPRAPCGQVVNRKSQIVNIILLLILAVAIFTRLPRLGYAEFHEDELENMRLIVRAYKGEEYAPFLDSKGPIHWLMPAALWYLNGWVNEGIARTPFVLASILLVPLMYSLGRRMSGGRDSVGLVAAGFVALNGFFIALARHVENRALIVLWGALAVWFAYRYYKENLNPHLLYAALTLAIGLIAHPNVLLYLPVFGYILWLKFRQNGAVWVRQWPWLVGAGAMFVGLTALFYVPYLTDPEIRLVYQYFAEERVGESLLYNQVGNIFVEDALYTTRYYAPVLVVLLTWLLLRYFARWRWWGLGLLAVLGGAIVSTVIWPEVWIVWGVNLAFLPAAVLGLAFMLLPNQISEVYLDPEVKILWLWFSLTLGALVFLAKDASNHIQMAYTGWSLLAALALVDFWRCLSIDRRPQTGDQKANLPSVPGLPSPVRLLLQGGLILYLALAIPLILFYQYLSFNDTVTAYWQTKQEAEFNPDSIYNWLYGGIPRPRRAISNPRLGGWKAVGYALETGQLSGDFRSLNESFAVPVWYTFQTPRSCYDDPQNYWVRRDWQGWPEEEQAVQQQGYTLTGIVLVDQTPMLHLYQKNAPPGEPEILNSEMYRDLFDRLAMPARFAQEDTPAQESVYNFGEKLRLRGFDPPPTTTHPGDLLPVTVYWEALAPMDTRYRAFMHLVGPDGALYGQHDDDPACRLLTTDMRPMQRSSRQFRLPVNPAAPPGDYQVIFGLYHPVTGERLPIRHNQTGHVAGDSMVLGTVQIN